MEYLQQQYLLAAYDLANENPSLHTFNEDDVANHIDLDPSKPGYVDRFISLTQYHLDKGHLALFHKGYVGSRRVLKLTIEGIEEAERLADPIEQRKEQRRSFLRAVYDLTDGNTTKYVYFRDMATRYGLALGTSKPPKEVKGFAEHLAGTGLIIIEGNAATAFRITTKGVDEVEGNKPQESSGPTFQFYGGVQGSVIGTHNTAELTNTFDFRVIEQRIEREGGEDKEELKRALDHVERLVESSEYLDRGALSKFSGVMERHSWFTSSVMQALLGFATQVLN